MPRTITFDLRIDWGLDGSYSDESSRLIAANGTLRLAAPESSISSPRGTVDQCTLTLANHDGRFSPLNIGGALYSSLQLGGAYHAPMYLRVSIDDGANYSRVFTGVIKIPREGPPYPGVGATVEIDCRSRDEILLNKRISTAHATFVALHEAGATESDIIAQFLDDGGLSGSDYTLDPGLFVIPWAWLDDESPIEDIWTLAAACGGRFYCDPDGEFRYENMAHWLMSPHDTSQETLTKASYGQMVGPTYDDRELYSGVTVVASPRDTLSTGTLWESDEIVVVPANTTRTIVAKMRQPAASIDSIEYAAVSGGGSNLDAFITINLTKFAQRVEIEIVNAHTTYAAELVNLTLVGSPVSGSPSVEETFESAHAFWTSYTSARPGRVRLLRGNSYVQSQPQAAALAEFLRDRYQLPRLSWRLQNVPGDPFRRNGDRITVGNADAMTSNRDGFLTGINWRLSNKGFVQDLELIDAGSVSDGTGLYPYAEYFILGTHELGASIHDIARIFY